MYNKLKTAWVTAKLIAEQSQSPELSTIYGPYISKSTRRLLRASYHHHKKLMREQKTRDRLKWFWERKELRKWLNERQNERRETHLRVRDSDTMATVKAPAVYWWSNGKPYLQPAGYFAFGRKQGFVDYHPTRPGDPPNVMHPVYGQKVVVNSLSCSMVGRAPNLFIEYPKGKWATNGRWLSPVTTDVSIPLEFIESHAQRALQLAYVDMKEPDIAMNEYVFEFKQFVGLLKDPIRTLARYQKLLNKWFSADAWFYANPIKVRRFGKGQLVSVATPGATLMSFRTKREVSVSDVSASTVKAAANRWLQYRYGILPLYLDVGAVAGMLAEKPIPSEWRKAQARFHVTRSKQAVSGTRAWNPTTHFYEGMRHEGLHYSATVYYKLEKELPLSYTMGLHPSQILRALWNRIPYSFVADWIVNVDDWLVAATNLPNSYIGRNCVTAKEYQKVNLTLKQVRFNYSPYPYLTLSSQPVMLALGERFNRHVDVPFENKLTFSSKWHSLKNAMTAEALLITEIFKRKK